MVGRTGAIGSIADRPEDLKKLGGGPRRHTPRVRKNNQNRIEKPEQTRIIRPDSTVDGLGVCVACARLVIIFKLVKIYPLEYDKKKL